MLLEAENEAFIIGHTWGLDEERVSFVTTHGCQSHSCTQTCLKGQTAITHGNDGMMAILFITMPIENNEHLLALGARQVLPKKAKPRTLTRGYSQAV